MIYGMKTDKQFINTFEDAIHIRGAMDKIVSDSAQVEIIGRVKNLLRTYVIGSWRSEAHQRQQKPAKRKY